MCQTQLWETEKSSFPYCKSNHSPFSLQPVPVWNGLSCLIHSPVSINTNTEMAHGNKITIPHPQQKNERERKLLEIFQFLCNPMVNNTLIWHQCAEHTDKLISPGRNLSRNNKINPLNTELNPICHLLALLGAHYILHISRIRVNDAMFE